MLAVEQTVDWGSIIAAVLPSVFSIAALVISALIHRQIRTPSGDHIGQVVERAHETGIANNLLLRQASGSTRPANGEELHAAASQPLAIPDVAPETT